MTSTKKPMADIRCDLCGSKILVGWNKVKQKDDTFITRYTYYCSKCGETQRISDNLD